MKKAKSHEYQTLHQFFYNGNTYFIDRKRLEFMKKEYGFNITTLTLAQESLEFLKKNKISTESFLEQISTCWVKI